MIVSGSSTVEPISTARRRAARGLRLRHRAPPSTAPAPVTASSCSAPARPTSPTPPVRSTRRRSPPARRPASSSSSSRSASTASRCMTSPDNDDRVPELRRPLRPDRPGVRGLRELERRPGAGHRARLGHRRFPDADLDITAPGEESGTYDSFIEIVFGDISEARVEAGAITEDQVETTRKDYSSQADDNAIIAGIEGRDSQPRLGRLRLRRGGRRRGQGDRRSPPSRAASASSPRPRRSPTARYPISRASTST